MARQQTTDDGVAAENDGDREDKETQQKEQKNHQARKVPLKLDVSDGKYRNKQRCLTVCSRGATARFRHLLEDFRALIPHHKRESKLDPGKEGIARALNFISTMRSCNSVLHLECRKHKDCYMWLSRTGGPSPGPSAKFYLSNIHTMDELRLTGNCLKGSRPILSFDKQFDQLDYLRLVKGLLIDVFGTPRGHPKAKPFVDRVMGFYYADNRIWVRNYQIMETQPSTALEANEVKKEEGATASTSLVEIGPRFVMCLIRIFRGSMGGPTLYQNPAYVSPNAVRAMERNKSRKRNTTYEEHERDKEVSKRRKAELREPIPNPLDDVFR